VDDDGAQCERRLQRDGRRDRWLKDKGKAADPPGICKK
jgi:hypothetical protein